VLVRRQDYQRRHDDRRACVQTKKIGGGPGGKTIIYGLTKNETKILEKIRSPRRRAEMFEGDLKGLEKNSSQSSCAAMRLRLHFVEGSRGFPLAGSGERICLTGPRTAVA